MKRKKSYIVGSTLFIIAISLVIFGIHTLSKSTGASFTTMFNPESSLNHTSSTNEHPVNLPQLTNEVSKNEIEVHITTTLGLIKVKVFPDLAPKAVENFITHSKDGYYDETTFHRVLANFMIQGGDPKGDGTGGESIWGEPFETEISPQLFHIRGALAMAKTNAPVSIGSQFYIVQNPVDVSASADPSTTPDDILEAYTSGGYPSLDQHYTVFGQVIEGMDVIDAISEIETDSLDKPLQEVKIESIEVID
ncbi:peptidyl-prolyl cis-trans isomerase [Carnobacterium sp. 17-4]|uniref:peptidylprolyl isomerase n=1 Tax=Carnobacterium sp. (strain 17-4) TaxID=208596 RepID=UPI00020586FE|nr:peptidylprolyl isomerase [Carnobacterium sp. 17-4]AEB29957.1 peptidyl-prolyl cis-trans isomerase [Carnobacterium sp. 17-4]